MNQFQQTIRIGQINYTNVWPIFHYFPVERFKERIQIRSQVPTQLNLAMREGTIDMGAISSFAYGEDSDRYEIFPDISVSARGPVKSILLFHRKPLGQLHRSHISLTTASATSVNLLKIIMEKFIQVQPIYSHSVPDLNTMLRDADAALLIGDDAIRASWLNRDLYVTDLGELWHQATGEWMTFAVWAIRKEVVLQQPALIAEIHEALIVSKQQGTSNRNALVTAAMQRIGGNEQYWNDYFDGLDHDFDGRQRSGLALYFKYAKELGLINHDVNFAMWMAKKAV